MIRACSPRGPGLPRLPLHPLLPCPSSCSSPRPSNRTLFPVPALKHITASFCKISAIPQPAHKLSPCAGVQRLQQFPFLRSSPRSFSPETVRVPQNPGCMLFHAVKEHALQKTRFSSPCFTPNPSAQLRMRRECRGGINVPSANEHTLSRAHLRALRDAQQPPTPPEGGFRRVFLRASSRNVVFPLMHRTSAPGYPWVIVDAVSGERSKG